MEEYEGKMKIGRKKKTEERENGQKAGEIAV